MNENKWLTGADGDAMLEFVADRLSAWQWVLLSAAYVRKLWDLLPDGVLRQAVDNAERATHPLDAVTRTIWIAKIDAAIPTAIRAAEALQMEIVRSCDPDAADLDRPILDRPNQIAPAFPLFQAASRNARNAIDGIGNALTEAAQAVRGLYSEPTEDMLELVRSRFEQASEIRTNANGAANNALRMKSKGDEIADEAAGAKNKRLMESIAIEEVRKIEEGPRQRTELEEFEAEEKRERTTRKQLALFLREVVGNPFTPPRFEPAWRTSTAVQLAQGIFDERAFDRMPILADALLDADCDEEAVLRHCRGTELWNKDKEPVYHIRGCWVIELVLERFVPLPPPKLDKSGRPRRKRSAFDDLDIGLPLDMGDDRLA
ncbi:MAG TPA: hypothetical protein VG122_07725 [Gemmata sp.]|jgi:hypothetical protein|nr:hypothetical protein [Gemmata sp.]